MFLPHNFTLGTLYTTNANAHTWTQFTKSSSCSTITTATATAVFTTSAVAPHMSLNADVSRKFHRYPKNVLTLEIYSSKLLLHSNIF